MNNVSRNTKGEYTSEFFFFKENPGMKLTIFFSFKISNFFWMSILIVHEGYETGRFREAI